LTEVKNMTLAQLRAFTAASQRAHKQRMAEELINARAAQYDKNSFSKYLKSLID